MVGRALSFPNTRQVMLRSTLKDVRETIWKITLPDVLKTYSEDLYKHFKDINSKVIRTNNSELYCEFENGSVISCLGLDDNSRLESILGQEYVTIYVNEASTIHSYEVIGLLQSRLSQRIEDKKGGFLEPKMLFDCNPPSSSHWTYRAFIEKVNPIDRTPWRKPKEWASIQMNPRDNVENIGKGYIERLQNTMSQRQQRRMIYGEFLTEVDGALFKPEWIAEHRIESIDLADLRRIVVAVDPAVSNTAKSDETGIIVAGIDADDRIYVLADRSLKGTPEAWARAVAQAYHDFQADVVVAEKNQGGDLVKTALWMADGNLPIKLVHSFRGKALRAEPVSALYERGMVSHVGYFKELEEQMEVFTHDYSRTKQGSPDRLDSLVYALSELAINNPQPNKVVIAALAGF